VQPMNCSNMPTISCASSSLTAPAINRSCHRCTQTGLNRVHGNLIGSTIGIFWSESIRSTKLA
jgi:hypothetical protein